ncbi:MAG: pitrilysin family protein [Candidatus Zixiibacteriota bacterium]
MKNGLRVITERIPSVRSISLGVWADVGSRNESKAENGLSHLIEHMVFKGTKNRTAKEIASSLESIGGSLNAFTSKEQTCFTARILDEHLDIGVDVLADLACHARFTPHNLAREKQVVYEEIKESKDTPSDYIHDIFAEAYWGDHPLGRPILGEVETLAPVRRSAIMGYLHKNYRAGSVVIAAAGSVSHDKLVRLVKEKFDFPNGSAQAYETAKRSTDRTVVAQPDDNQQIHICLGFPSVKYDAREKMAVLALQSYLGGGMSSVLFQKIREEKGLAYTVYTFNEFYRDAGQFGAYMSADKKNLAACIQITLKELTRTTRKRLDTKQLDQIKAQLKGQLTLGMESTYSRMNRLARQELMLGSYIPVRKSLREIDRVTPQQVLEQANKTFDNSQIAIAVLGIEDKSAIENAL